MRLLMPTDAPFATHPLDDHALAEIYAYPGGLGPERPWVRANFVSTLDGAANGSDGRSGSINTGADREVFALLRALSDVILVGAGTARTEGYRPPVVPDRWQPLRDRQGLADQPAMAVVTRSGDLPPLVSEQRQGAGDVLLLTCESAPAEAVGLARRSLGEDHVVVCGDESVDLRGATHLLARQGLPRVLCEGGPHLMHDLTASGVLDELCLTIAPRLIAGEHPRILDGPATSSDLVPRSLIEADGSLLGRWVRSDAP